MPPDSISADTLLEALVPSGGGQNLLDIIGLAGGFQYPILLLFVLGLGALMNTLIRMFHDSKESRTLREWDIMTQKTQDFREVSKQEGQSVYHILLRRLVHRIQFTSDHGALLKTVAVVLQVQEERIALTSKLVTYCSSAAGGLGLAGTLVGMYSSFAAAGTDPSTVTVGISLALVSTLLGVFTSLILETAETFVSRYVKKQYAASREWGEDICARMSHLQRTANAIRKQKSKAPGDGK